MTNKEKDELVARIITGHIPGRNCSLSDFISVDERVGMGEAIEVVQELDARGFVKIKHRLAEDLRFSVNDGLHTFSQRGGFEAEDIVFQAKLQKVFLEISKLQGELEPGLYKKIMDILEPLGPYVGAAVNALL